MRPHFLRRTTARRTTRRGTSRPLLGRGPPRRPTRYVTLYRFLSHIRARALDAGETWRLTALRARRARLLARSGSCRRQAWSAPPVRWGRIRTPMLPLGWLQSYSCMRSESSWTQTRARVCAHRPLPELPGRTVLPQAGRCMPARSATTRPSGFGRARSSGLGGGH